MTAASPLARYRAVDGALPSGSAAPSYTITGDTTTAKLWTLSRSRAWQLVKSVMKQADIAAGPHATPKGLRHGFGLHAIRSGVPLNLVQRWLGHARMETTAIYLQAMGIEEREIAARMWTDPSITATSQCGSPPACLADGPQLGQRTHK